MRILTISSYFSILFYSILFDLLVDKNSCDGRYILLDCWIFIVQINFSTWTGEKRWRTCREFRTDNLILKQSAYAFYSGCNMILKSMPKMDVLFDQKQSMTQSIFKFLINEQKKDNKHVVETEKKANLIFILYKNIYYLTTRNTGWFETHH